MQDVGFAAEEAHDGVEALVRIAEHTPDLVLAEVRMPRLDGCDLGHLLAAQAATIPILLMSTDPPPRDGHLPFIRKPFALDDLLTFLARTLPRSSVATVARADLGAK